MRQRLSDHVLPHRLLGLLNASAELQHEIGGGDDIGNLKGFPERHRVVSHRGFSPCGLCKLTRRPA